MARPCQAEQVALQGKTALITGGARRIGRAIALALAEQRVNVVVHYHHSGQAADALAAELSSMGVEAFTVNGDLATPDAAAAIVDAAVARAGPIDFLFNNASIFPADTFATFSWNCLRDNVAVHAMAPVILARAFAKQGRDGCILNLLDSRMGDYDKEHLSYHLSKRMLSDLTRIMAVEFAPAIRVNAIAPGLILPPEGKDDAYLERLAATNPLGQYGSPAMIADAAVFLLQSGFVTGQTIFVDGGRHLRGHMYE